MNVSPLGLLFLWQLTSISAKISTEKDVINYLARFGYLETEKEKDETKPFGDRFFFNKAKPSTVSPEKMSEALKNFQSFFGLAVTGQIDNSTMNLMSRPRCGNLEMLENQVGTPRRKRYAHSNFAWTNQNLTYRLSQLPSNSKEPYSDSDKIQLKKLIEGELDYAFSLWADVVELNFFRSATETEPVDIDIKFVEGKHGDDYEFDGRGFMIAHAFHPNPANKFAGDIHFDNEETWIIGLSPEDEEDIFNFRWGAIHEIGHSLGLEHSYAEDAYMFPLYPASPYDPDTPLHADDIFGIEALYATRFSLTTPQPPEQPHTMHSKETEQEQAATNEHQPKPSQPKIRQHTYNAAKVAQFADGLFEIMNALNPTSANSNLLACKLLASNRNQHLCIPDSYLL